jgi:hypothetical protein
MKTILLLLSGFMVFSSPSASYSNDVAFVSKARFVTAGAISMNLGVRIPLGNTPRAFFDFLNLTYFVAYRRSS